MGIVVYVKVYGMGIKIFPWYGVDKNESQVALFITTHSQSDF
jgi:hypothetical protein